MRSDSRLLCTACVFIAATVFPAHGQFFQEAKLVGTGASGAENLGTSVALSADGNIALIGWVQRWCLPVRAVAGHSKATHWFRAMRPDLPISAVRWPYLPMAAPR